MRRGEKQLRELEVGRETGEHGVTGRERELGRSQTLLKRKWAVTVCLGGQRLPWVRVRANAGNLGPNAGKTLFEITSNIISLMPEGWITSVPLTIESHVLLLH